MTRILLVEDEAAIAAGVQDDLELEGYAVDLAADGVTAESKARAGNYDLILLDVMLPKQHGLAVCRRIRESGIRTPVIMLTARGQESDKVAGLDAGADDYITKPFGRRELLARVNAALRRGAMPAGAPAKICRFGNCRIDFNRREATKGAHPIDLTALEFKLLQTFLAHHGEVLPIDRLSEEVWGKEVFITDRVVYTHMNNLRKKIEDDPQRPRHLITLRGIGYRFDT